MLGELAAEEDRNQAAMIGAPQIAGMAGVGGGQPVYIVQGSVVQPVYPGNYVGDGGNGGVTMVPMVQVEDQTNTAT